MGGLARRLRAIEERERRRFGTPEEREQAIGREVLRRMSTPELEALEAAAERYEAGEAFTAEDLEVLDRFTQLREAVISGELTD